jgi:hypothetical protein
MYGLLWLFENFCHLRSIRNPSRRVGDVVPVHSGSAVYGALSQSQTASAFSALPCSHPTGPSRMGSRSRGPPGQGIRTIPVAGHDGGVSTHDHATVSPPVICCQHYNTLRLFTHTSSRNVHWAACLGPFQHPPSPTSSPYTSTASV